MDCQCLRYSKHKQPTMQEKLPFRSNVLNIYGQELAKNAKLLHNDMSRPQIRVTPEFEHFNLIG